MRGGFNVTYYARPADPGDLSSQLKQFNGSLNGANRGLASSSESILNSLRADPLLIFGSLRKTLSRGYRSKSGRVSLHEASEQFPKLL
jgi:hypothetical protein